MILYLHGGPGGFSTLQHHRYRNVLEPDYLIAYLDQRGCGQSSAIDGTDQLTMTQYLRDLQLVVQQLLDRYAKPGLNLMGDSWGASYGFLYVLKHPSQVVTLISNGGVADAPYGYRNLIEKEKELARGLLTETRNEKEIAEYRRMITALERIERSSFDDFYAATRLIKRTIPRQLNFNPYRVNSHGGPPSEEVLADAGVDLETAKGFFTKGRVVNEAFRTDPAFNNLNMVNRLADIAIPVLVIQGDGDYSIGIDQARIIFAGLTERHPGNKELAIVPNAGHDTADENPEVVFPLLRGFLERYNL
ncbi:alpha/beta fold hydrolase [Lewinella sp. IMCC34183]|uniref:alpha/beta fold hydrolase n=1 Tax=Lewinella sp. IMCC34183 TaxID=2248762 RepID=UPI0013003753|nr:alpha/beta hydrolase [Lewinella sp. IMCC34183]